jgi:hypothetical protein
LDERLVQAFGRIKFKVQTITKSARYGIKLYVLTNAMTAFVLKVIVYNGAATYNISDAQDKKTVKVVKQLVERYNNTHCTLYIDRLYTSIDLMKVLDKVNLDVTGTVMKNRLPKEVVIANSSKEYTQMTRGSFKSNRYTYYNEL